MKKDSHKPYLFWILGILAPFLGLVSGFVISYTDIIKDFTIYQQHVIANSAYIQALRNDNALAKIEYMDVMRKEVKSIAEGKMNKTRAWDEIQRLEDRIRYLEHQNGKTI